MQKIKFIKNYKFYRAGDITIVDNNTAFSLIDAKMAVLSKNYVNYQNKMMTPRPKKGYKIK